VQAGQWPQRPRPRLESRISDEIAPPHSEVPANLSRIFSSDKRPNFPKLKQLPAHKRCELATRRFGLLLPGKNIVPLQADIRGRTAHHNTILSRRRVPRMLVRVIVGESSPVQLQTHLFLFPGLKLDFGEAFQFL
jgi:hypothetical protein